MSKQEQHEHVMPDFMKWSKHVLSLNRYSPHFICQALKEAYEQGLAKGRLENASRFK